MSRDGFEGLYVYPSLEAEALDCGGHALLREIDTLLSPFSTETDAWRAFATTLYGQSEIVKVDGEGRIVLSEAARTHAGLSSDVTFVGMGRKFQIWEPSRFRAFLAEAKGQVREARKLLGSHAAATGMRSSPGARG